MRLWSLHPKYLDPKGLVALWREALVAQAVLRGATRGYRRHPQLERFRAQASPTGFIAEYLRAVHAESVERGYRFDAGRIAPDRAVGRIDVTRGQIAFEWGHLRRKLDARAPEWRNAALAADTVLPHPLFRAAPGRVEGWDLLHQFRKFFVVRCCAVPAPGEVRFSGCRWARSLDADRHAQL